MANVAAVRRATAGFSVWLKKRGTPGYWLAVRTLAEAVEEVRRFIDNDGDPLGSEWEGGNVEHDGSVRFHVSPNGRVWCGPQDRWTPDTVEILWTA